MLLIALNLLPIKGIPAYILYLAAYIVIGYDILRKAFKNIKRRQVFDENFLMAVATIGAIVLAIYEKSGDFNEAVAVMLFYQIGELSRAMPSAKAARALPHLWIYAPTTPTLRLTVSLSRLTPMRLRLAAS